MWYIRNVRAADYFKLLSCDHSKIFFKDTITHIVYWSVNLPTNKKLEQLINITIIIL